MTEERKLEQEDKHCDTCSCSMKKDWIIRQADIMFIVGLGLMITAHFLTILTIYAISDHSANVADVARAYEGNPLLIGLLSSVSGVSFIIQFIALPGISFASYYTIRRLFKNANPMFVFMLGAIAMFSGLLNVTNDLGAWIGVLLRYGA
jgi:hypothetical protein